MGFLAKRRKETAAEPEQLQQQLAVDRSAQAVQRMDELARRAAQTRHRMAVADVREHAATARLARRERARDAREGRRLTRLYRRAQISGTRARLAAEIKSSGEVRALRLARLQSVVLAVGVPVLVAFGAWSTTGVQAGVAWLLGLTRQDPGWWAAWLVEPAIITIVAGIIVFKAILRSSGGNVDERATRIEAGALVTSIGLNAAGVLAADHGGLVATFAAVASHSIGPVGAAVTAYLIGLLVDYITAADPWRDAPRLADMNLTLPPAADPAGVAPASVDVVDEQPAVRRSGEVPAGWSDADEAQLTELLSGDSPARSTGESATGGGDSPAQVTHEGDSPAATVTQPAKGDSPRTPRVSHRVIHRPEGGSVPESVIQKAEQFDGDAEQRMALLWHLSHGQASGRQLARVGRSAGQVSDATGIRRAARWRVNPPGDPRST